MTIDLDDLLGHSGLSNAISDYQELVCERPVVNRFGFCSNPRCDGRVGRRYGRDGIALTYQVRGAGVCIKVLETAKASGSGNCPYCGHSLFWSSKFRALPPKSSSKDRPT